MGCRKIDVIEFIAMARERGRGSVESDNRFAVNRSETRCRRYARFSQPWETPLDCAVN
jgi:hypothetical protein